MPKHFCFLCPHGTKPLAGKRRSWKLIKCAGCGKKSGDHISRFVIAHDGKWYHWSLSRGHCVPEGIKFCKCCKR